MTEIHTTPDQRLVMMANQIARAFAAQGQERAIAKTAEHIKAFWDPRMRRRIDAHVVAGGEGLDSCALTALRRLMAGTEKPVPADEHSPFDQGSDAG